MTWQWNDRAAAACRHGYPHGDCPLACLACGHRCEIHSPDGRCGAVDCGCPAWVDEDGGDGPREADD